ncbi:MAG: lysophospholipid acyltransferase family protein [Alphaproteobacteria bacterium]
MRFRKRILHSEVLRNLFCSLLSYYLRFVYFTTRWQHNRYEHLDPLFQSGKPFIIALWHNRIMMMPLVWPYDKPVTILTSGHRDGQLVSRTMGKFGFNAIHGSSEQGGTQALRGIIREIRSGKIIGMTPDGPRGPRMRLKPGIITMARLTGAPILPVCYSTHRNRFMKTWDKLLVPLPFGRGKVVWDEPIYIPKTATRDDEEDLRLKLEEAMNRLAISTDTAVGSLTVEPAPDPVEQGS